jgi:predicted Na+-dependent transporter
MLGFCYLCALPYKVSSSVALTEVAKGNVPAAIFNATISGLIGIVDTTLISRKLSFNTEDEIAAVFCASKKTLAPGVPMAKIIFGAHPGLSLIMLPIIYSTKFKALFAQYLQIYMLKE